MAVSIRKSLTLSQPMPNLLKKEKMKTTHEY